MTDTAILFLDSSNACLSRMAEAFALARTVPGLVVASAGLQPLTIDLRAVRAMQEADVDIPAQSPRSVVDLDIKRFDVVVRIGGEEIASSTEFFGLAASLQWNVRDPSFDAAATPEDFLATARQIRSLVDRLFDEGTLDALAGQARLTEDILESLSEGVLAHDLDRRILYFSRGAERLTGLTRAEALGRDCHEIFQPRLCSGECAFQDGHARTRIGPRRYSSVVLAQDGTRREFDVSLIAMRNSRGEPTGVVASLTDQTRVRELEHRLEETTQFRGIIGQDHRMQMIYDLIKELAECDFPVVVTGESGTGKELVAQAIHAESPRRDKLFVPVNCGALPEGTLESELFGHVKGAFTGAIRDKKGRFDLADGGTLFLDEVSELSQAMQVKLLRVLQEGTFEPVGGERTSKVNVRVISATNRDLKALIKSGSFREDLYYRLAVVPIDMPPLRQRRNDIPLLARHFLTATLQRMGRAECGFSDQTMSLLMSYAWPGNVRQLQNAIQFSLIKSRNEEIQPHHLPPEITASAGLAMQAPPPEDEPGKVGRRPKLSLEMVRTALERTAGNRAKAARILGVGRATLYNFLGEHPELEDAGAVDK